MNILEQIHSPAELKYLSETQLEIVATQIRELIIKTVAQNGGHLAPCLGTVELTLALHKVFSCPRDKFVWDVGHQAYAHKILTGRLEKFSTLRQKDGITGFPNRFESEYDAFGVGHASTSISAALGMAVARDLDNEDYNVIAIIGDGALTGGEAFEGLNNAGMSKRKLIVILNDNEMSIAENHGGLYQNLKALRDSDGQTPCNFFKSLGLDYIYVKDGNDITALIHAFTRVKDVSRPVVVHIHTLKGKGYTLAETYKERFHWGMPFNLETGQPLSDGGEHGRLLQFDRKIPAGANAKRPYRGGYFLGNTRGYRF